MVTKAARISYFDVPSHTPWAFVGRHKEIGCGSSEHETNLTHAVTVRTTGQ